MTRVLALGALLVALGVVVVLAVSGGTTYTVKADFINAGQIVKGNLVEVSGSPVGKVSDIDVTADGQARLTLHITDPDYSPLRRGTRAVVREASLSGVANRYVDLRLPPGDARSTGTWAENSVIPTTDTTSAVDLDQLFATFDPRTRRGLQDVLKGSADQYRGEGERARAGFAVLDPYLAASSALFRELNRDTPRLRRFLVANGNVLADLAERRGDLTGLVTNLSATTGALSEPRGRLGRAIRDLPAFMRRANSTFVDLRSTLDTLDPLVAESKPVARRLRPFFATLRPLARDARPTLADLSALVRRPGAANDLVELTRGSIPLANAAVRRVRAHGKLREGAFPASVRALRTSSPELAEARPYSVDLMGWFDDFSHSGVYDAAGASSRVSPNANAFSLQQNGDVLSMLPLLPQLRSLAFSQIAATGQYDRCPGSAVRGGAFKPTPDFPCDITQVPPGP